MSATVVCRLSAGIVFLLGDLEFDCLVLRVLRLHFADTARKGYLVACMVLQSHHRHGVRIL